MVFSAPLLQWFWILILLSALAMKLSSWKATKTLRPPLLPFLLLSPVLSVPSWNKKRPSTSESVVDILARGALTLAALTLSGWLYFKLVPDIGTRVLIQSYCAILPLYLLGQFLSTLLELIYLPTGWHFPAHFQYPLFSKNLNEFWNRRWASWVSDWLQQMVFFRMRRRPVTAMILSFILSGLWHEILINVPLLIYGGVNMLGSMLAYFTIQAIGIIAEKKLRLRSKALRRIFLWIIVVLPSPLIINEGVLRAFGFGIL